MLNNEKQFDPLENGQASSSDINSPDTLQTKPKTVLGIVDDVSSVTADTGLSGVAKAEELLKLTTELRQMNDKWKRREGWKNMPSVEQIKIAQEILSKREVLGPEQIEKAFGIKLTPEQIPQIPFTSDELERAQELGQFLILRVDKDLDGEQLTMERMEKMLVAANFGAGEIVSSSTDISDKKSFRGESFFTGKKKGLGSIFNKSGFSDDSVPRLGWALVAKEPIANSEDQNLFVQSLRIQTYLVENVFRIKETNSFPAEYSSAFRDYSLKFTKHLPLLRENGKANKKARDIELGKIVMQNPAEVLYDISMYYLSNGEKLFEGRKVLTNVDNSDKLWVCVCPFSNWSVVSIFNEDFNSEIKSDIVFSRRF